MPDRRHWRLHFPRGAISSRLAFPGRENLVAALLPGEALRLRAAAGAIDRVPPGWP
jgi:hypothetical protein